MAHGRANQRHGRSTVALVGVLVHGLERPHTHDQHSAWMAGCARADHACTAALGPFLAGCPLAALARPYARRVGTGTPTHGARPEGAPALALGPFPGVRPGAGPRPPGVGPWRRPGTKIVDHGAPRSLIMGHQDR